MKLDFVIIIALVKICASNCGYTIEASTLCL
uniref:Uncharacterized protein n=1 Tax=Pandinus cavimanus TaxID=217261 RepID=H2CYP0_PANCV|nr:hypothetical protein [Pandinus cavimanus]